MSDIKLDVFISYILRHNPDAIGVKMDIHGWVEITELINGINKDSKYTKYNLDFEMLKDIVKKSIKKDDARFSRYSFNDDFTKIRANQGHSIPGIDVELEERIPPDVLYHGTAIRFMDSINEKGINKGKRLHVHLSDNIDTAIDVGTRHGEPIILKIDAKKLHADGCKFFISKNNVWLCDFVPVGYFEKC